MIIHHNSWAAPYGQQRAGKGTQPGKKSVADWQCACKAGRTICFTGLSESDLGLVAKKSKA